MTRGTEPLLRAIDEGLWIADAPQRFLGLQVGSRMTVVRLADDSLLLHSPVAATASLVGQVLALGPVSCLVAPNRFHHLHVQSWQQACPAARTWVAPGLTAKRPDLRIAGVLCDQPEPAWAEVLEQLLVQGFPLANEVVFFHRATATLVATNLAFNFGADSPALTRLAVWLGRGGPLRTTVLERLAVRDRAAHRASLECILAWPFERVVVAHGDICEHGGREALARGYAWLLGPGPSG